MFCPRCAAQNESEQGYCRQCGQALSGVRLALEGSSRQSLEKLKAGEKWISGGSFTLVAFTLIAVAIAILGIAAHDLSFGYIALINLLLGSFIGLPLVYLGKAKLKHAARLLSTSASALALDEKHQDTLLTTGLNADLSRLPVHGSVTEHTTLELREPEGDHRKPR